MGIRLLRAKGARPTASPRMRPIATESANAMPSSQNVMRSAAGTPGVSSTVCSDMKTREGGLRNIGSTHRRAATSHNANRRTITPMRVSHGRCSHDSIEAAVIAAASRAPRARTRVR